MDRRKQQRCAVAALLVAATLIVGCGDDDVAEAPRERPVTHFSEPAPYVSFAEMAKEATEILLIKSEAASVETVNEVPFTVTDAIVVESIRSESGLKPGDTVRVRQTGDEEYLVSGAEHRDALLDRGSTQLVFLRPFEFADRKPTGQFTTPRVGTVFEVSDDRIVVWRTSTGYISGVSMGETSERTEVGLDEVRQSAAAAQ